MRYGSLPSPRGQRLQPGAVVPEHEVRRSSGGGSTDVEGLPEESVEFDDSAGHAHSGADGDGTPVSHASLTGVGANDHHAQAHSLMGSDHTVSGLTAGHVLTALSATSFGFAAPAASSGGSAYSQVGLWTRDNISNAPGMMPIPTGADYHQNGQIMPFAGTLWAISVTTESHIGYGAGSAYTVTAHLDSGGIGFAPTALTTSITAGADAAFAVHGSGIPFNAGDLLTIYDALTSGPLTATQSAACLWVAFS